jgi:nitroreductase
MASYDELIDVARRRRSVRKVVPGGCVPRKLLEQVLEAGRWAPSGANTQPWDYLCVDEPETIEAVPDVFVSQGTRLHERAPEFPAVHKRYLANTAAIILVLGDPRWKVCYPRAGKGAFAEEYDENNENIFYCSLGAAIQNLQLAVTALGLTSAWLSGGGERQTARGTPRAAGHPGAAASVRNRPDRLPSEGPRAPLSAASCAAHPLESIRRAEVPARRPVEYYRERVRPFAMYRSSERMEDWDDLDERLGPWRDAFVGAEPNASAADAS